MSAASIATNRQSLPYSKLFLPSIGLRMVQIPGETHAIAVPTLLGAKEGNTSWLSACMSSGPPSYSVARSRQTPRPVWVRPPSLRPPDGRIFIIHRDGEHAAHPGE